MLTKLRIKNFKCLQDTGDLDIRPLTFLVGPNSSGKSSVLQMLLMLRQTVDSTDIENPLAANDGWVQMGAYPEFIYKGEYRRPLEVSLELTQFVPAILKGKPIGREPSKLTLRAVFSYNRKTTRIHLQERDIALDGILRQHLVRDQTGKRYAAAFTYLEEGKTKEVAGENVTPIKFYGLSIAAPGRGRRKHLGDPLTPLRLFSFHEHVIESEFRRMFYLGPLREFPRRFYVTSGQAPQDVGTRGERAVDVLWFSHRSETKALRGIEDAVRRWMNEFGIALDVRLKRLGRGNYYRVVITDPATGFEPNLADIGFGASQTLPIIIESFYVPAGSVILIEQPEIHLHPKAQSTLGDLFIEAARDGNRAFIIETHSEHILARVRRRIAEGKIEKEKVAIYYFEPTSEGTHIQEVTVNENGQYERFPEGFFEEDFFEALEHLKAIKASGR